MLLPIYIPDRWLAVSLNLRSALDSFSRISLSLRKAVPFGFWCGGFSSTAGYVSGNEAQIRRSERLTTTSRLIISLKRDCVFIRVAQESLATLPKPTLSASARGVKLQQPPVATLK